MGGRARDIGEGEKDRGEGKGVNNSYSIYLPAYV